MRIACQGYLMRQHQKIQCYKTMITTNIWGNNWTKKGERKKKKKKKERRRDEEGKWRKEWTDMIMNSHDKWKPIPNNSISCYCSRGNGVLPIALSICTVNCLQPRVVRNRVHLLVLVGNGADCFHIYGLQAPHSKIHVQIDSCVLGVIRFSSPAGNAIQLRDKCVAPRCRQYPQARCSKDLVVLSVRGLDQLWAEVWLNEKHRLVVKPVVGEGPALTLWTVRGISCGLVQ